MPPSVIVVPCFNEAGRLDAERFADAAGAERHFVFVDDGSTDATPAVLERIAATAPAGTVAIVRHAVNRGKAEAVRTGLLEACDGAPGHIAYLDADLATPIAQLDRVLAALDEGGWDATLGARVGLLGRAIERRPARHYLGRVFATGASTILGIGVYDTQCGAKAFRTSAALRRALADPFLSRWAFDVELLGRLRIERRRDGDQARFYEVPLDEWRDVAGSKLRPLQMLSAAAELDRIRRDLQRRRRLARQ